MVGKEETKRMRWSGIIVAWLIVLGAIRYGSEFLVFVDLPSLLMTVVGGHAAAAVPLCTCLARAPPSPGSSNSQRCAVRVCAHALPLQQQLLLWHPRWQLAGAQTARWRGH